MPIKYDDPDEPIEVDLDLQFTEESECGNKRPFPNELAAEAAMRQLCEREGLDPNDFKIYKCHYCDFFHYGHIYGRKSKTPSFIPTK